MKKRDGLPPPWGGDSPALNWRPEWPGLSPWVLAFAGKEKDRLPCEGSGPVFANCYVGLVCERLEPPVVSRRRNLQTECRSVKAAKADSDALDLAYRLLNVHKRLLVVVVDPPGIQGAVCVC